MKLFSLRELSQASQEPEGNPDKSEILRTKFVQAHCEKVVSLKNLMGSYPMPGEAFFLFTLSSFNAFTFIVYIIKHVGTIDELTFSTYSLNERILNSLVKWYDKGEIKQVNLSISDSIRHRMPKVYDQIEIHRKERRFGVRYCWNHSKVTLISAGGHYFTIEGSGNFSENAMHEQYLFMNDKTVYEFRRRCLLSLD
ncbi:hypothetical protein C943_03295 [Mariniradius saccharolyticus AK6]|uniref:Phospholipase D-like domain-containing protein n=1 Tax=Mariniradius saccharolyticus AK6 TaxID=1239962 RepID=M7XJ71_9BACT|nr:hypothetical protein [Mariniradius saccharolyticus]EMS34608.1 hypothetical protein C943_03295 [Mariniradius saccharolyticus AK6]